MILAVDPGKTGALAFLDRDGKIREIFDMPEIDGWVSAALVSSHIHAYMPELAVVEAVHSFPKQGVASTFKFGTGYGIILGVIAALDIPMVHKTPSEWKKHFHLSNDKERSRRMAIDRWPAEADRFRLKKHEGRAEAALLALTWLEQNPQAQKRVIPRYRPRS